MVYKVLNNEHLIINKTIFSNRDMYTDYAPWNIYLSYMYKLYTG